MGEKRFLLVDAVTLRKLVGVDLVLTTYVSLLESFLPRNLLNPSLMVEPRRSCTQPLPRMIPKLLSWVLTKETTTDLKISSHVLRVLPMDLPLWSRLFTTNSESKRPS